MNSIEQNVIGDAPNLTAEPASVIEMPSPAPQLSAIASLRAHWPEYLMEAALLGAFMVSACVFGALYEFPQSPIRQAIHSQFLRRLLMGLSMGTTAIAIIYSP
jgi:aquaporin Z